MQSSNGRILLSPSDLNDYVSCRHLTTLAREVARGERDAPHVADEGAQLLQEKGELHELQFLERLRAEGREVVEIAMDEALGLRRRCGPYAGRDASRRRCDRASDVRERPVARPRRLPDEDAGCIEPRRLELRSARREARSRREADLRAPALFLQRRHRQRSGPTSRAHARASRHRRATYAALRRFRRLLPPRASAVRRGRRLDGGNRGLSGRALRPVRLSCRVSIPLDRRGSSRAGGGSSPRASRATARRRIADDDGTRSGRAGNRRSADRAPFLRDLARSGGAPGRKAYDRTTGLACDRVRRGPRL